jgi:glucose-6-phosphate isomerase
MDMEPWFFFEGGDLVFGEPGEYRADFVPSQPGKYTFHFTGTIDGEEIDEEMTSGPDTFSVVEDAASASFPTVEAPSNAELATRIDEESARTADAVAAAEAAAASADDAASSARTVGMVGVVLGAIGIIAAIAALASSRRKA